MSGTPDFYRRASAFYKLGRVREAIRELQSALAEDPNDASSHALLALCLCRLKDYRGAMAEAKAAIGLEPERAHSYYAQAWILLCQRKLGVARQAIVEALRLEPQSATYWACAAEIESRDDRHHMALETSARGLEIDPEDVDCLISRSEALASLGRPGEALAAAQQAIAIDPDASNAHAAAGWVYLSQFRRGPALPFFREATRLDPESNWARIGHRHALSGGWINTAVWLGLMVCFVALSAAAIAGARRVSPQSEAVIISIGFLCLAFVRFFMAEEFLFGHAEGRRFLAVAEPSEYWSWCAFCAWLGCGLLPLWNAQGTVPWIAGLTILPTIAWWPRARARWMQAALAAMAVVQVALAAFFTIAWLESWAKELALGVAVVMAAPLFLWTVLMKPGVVSSRY